MKISPNHKLFLRDVFLYDIEACHFTIMNKLGLDLSGIDITNKEERNILIGKMMKKNPRLTTLLRNTTNSIIDEYILRNNLKEDDILLRQYDGIIIKKKLHETKIGGIPLNIRKNFEIFIISIDRNKYIAYDTEKEYTIKGVSSKYDNINNYYRMILKINFANKTSVFKNLQIIKDSLMDNNDPYTFGIPEKNNKCIIFLKGYGEVEITTPTLRIIDTNDIDKEKYFKHYLEPFMKSIVIEFLK